MHFPFIDSVLKLPSWLLGADLPMIGRRVALGLAAALATAAAAGAAERTGWENIPANEPALVCRVELKEKRPVLHGQSQAVFRVPMASEPIRVPPFLRRPPVELSRESSDADRAAWDNWSRARSNFLKLREDRFKELLAKARPEESRSPAADCDIETLVNAGKWTHGAGWSRPPFLIGFEIRDPYNPEDIRRPVYAKVYHEDFLPPDWTAGLPGVEVANAEARPKPPAPSTGGSLTVKQETGAADVRRAWDAQVAKALQEEAQKNALTLARAAQADARLQADAEKARQERLKRGRAQ
jgi:hypothetical protein